MGYKHFITLFLCLCQNLIDGPAAQVSSRFLKELTIEEGLSSNKINDIVQDDEGFLWIATNDGLNLYDGTEVLQFYHQDKINSIAHNYVHCLKKLPGNKIAIGTSAGLSFYDRGRGKFQNFYYRQNNALDEFNNIIVAMELDVKGNLWAASRNCVFVFDPQLQLKKIIHSSYTEADAEKQRLRFADRFLPLTDGNMLLYLYNGWYICTLPEFKIEKLAHSTYSRQLGFLNEMIYRSQKRSVPYVPSANVFKVFSQYFLCMSSGTDSLFLINERGLKICSYQFPYNKYPFVSWSQKVVAMDLSRLLFLFHNYGLVEISIRWENNKPLIKSLSPLLFESFEYHAALQDHDGNWWLMTANDGLQEIASDKSLFKTDALVDRSSSKPVSFEMVSLNRYKNHLWLSTYGDGFFKKDLVSGKQQQFRLTDRANDPWQNFIWNVRQVSDDTLWLGTQAGMYWYCLSKNTFGRLRAQNGKPSVLDSVPVTTQFVDSRGWVWMGLGKGKGLCSFDPGKRSFRYYPGNASNGYPLRYPTSIAEDKKGDLWFTNDASARIVRWDRESQQFDIVSLPHEVQGKVGDLKGIWCEGDSIIWLGTVASGLIKYNLFSRSVVIYGREKGIGDSYVASIFQDSLKRLWLVTNGGLSCFDQQTGSFINYMAKNGLPVKYPTAAFFYDSVDKRLYTGGAGSFFCFDPEMMNPPQPPRKTIITSLEVNGKLYHFSGKVVKLKSAENNISIHYTAVDLTSGADTKYAYKLIGEDTGWVMADRQRQINFSRLAPGDYLFMVRASGNNENWNTEAASLRFSIRKPFSQTFVFYGLIALVMGSAFYGLYRFRLAQLARTEQIRSEISKNLHDEVGSTLTNISLSSLLAQKQINNEASVSRLLERIYQDSQTVSETMREIVWSINPEIDTLGEALPRMLHYASEILESKNIELEAEISPGIDDVKLSMQRRRDLYLIFKETINNLAKHSNATKAKVAFHIEKDMLTMTISDNGSGFDKSMPQLNYGLKNMKARAQSHSWQLLIQSEPGAGTTLTLRAAVA